MAHKKPVRGGRTATHVKTKPKAKPSAKPKNKPKKGNRAGYGTLGAATQTQNGITNQNNNKMFSSSSSNNIVVLGHVSKDVNIIIDKVSYLLGVLVFVSDQ